MTLFGKNKTRSGIASDGGEAAGGETPSAGTAAEAQAEYASYQETSSINNDDGTGAVLSAKSSSVPPRPNPGVYRPNRPYNGFSTSICSLFQYSPADDEADDTSTVRTDCCSMACFGILQSDRTRYLATGKLPPSLFRRMWIHIFLPLAIFLAAGYAAVLIKDDYTNSFLTTMLVLVMFMYIAMDCFRGTVKRRRVREEMLWRMREVDMISNGRGDEAIETEIMVRSVGSRDDGTHGPVDLGQSKFAMTCVHRMFGCARVDYPTGREDEPQPEDFCSKLWNFFANLCCGKLCKCWFQFCGVCALAQEAREVERLIPAGRRRIDYVTFEPYMSYYNPIRMLRDAKNSSLLVHYHALSHLSTTLVKALAIAVVSMLILSFIPRFGGFTKGDLVVVSCQTCVSLHCRYFDISNNPIIFLVARAFSTTQLVMTLCQAFLILWLVHWKWHRFDISLDAVIKYFACGFLLTTGLAVFFELVETIFIHIFLILAISLSGIQTVKSNDYSSIMPSRFGGNGDVSFAKLGARFLTSGFSGGHGRYLQDQADDASKTFAREYPVVTIIYLFINAYLMAAFVEELCKYFGFRMVEHPDFLTDEQLQEGTEAVAAAERRAARENALEQEEDEDDDVAPGEDCGAYEAMQGDLAVKVNEAAEAAASAADAAVSAAVDAVGARSPRAESNLKLAPAPQKTLNGKGAAITVAMVAVALGFACCENLIYIFIYNASSLERSTSGLRMFCAYCVIVLVFCAFLVV